MHSFGWPEPPVVINLSTCLELEKMFKQIYATGESLEKV